MKFGLSRDKRAKNRFALILVFFLGMSLISPLFEHSFAAGFVADMFFYLFLFAPAVF